MILYSEQCLSRCESFSRPPLPTHNRGAHFYTPSSAYRDASLSPILLDAPFISQQLEGMADDALPQAIRHALATAFKKKPAATLDQWAALCAKAGMGDVDDGGVASCRVRRTSTHGLARIALCSLTFCADCTRQLSSAHSHRSASQLKMPPPVPHRRSRRRSNRERSVKQPCLLSEIIIRLTHSLRLHIRR